MLSSLSLVAITGIGNIRFCNGFVMFFKNSEYKLFFPVVSQA